MNTPLYLKSLMSLESGEGVVGIWATSEIPGTGSYQLMAKSHADGSCEWSHLIKRENGSMSLLYQGDVDSPNEMESVVEAVEETLVRIFGSSAKLGLVDTSSSSFFSKN